mmetsp:Transcript_414/g.591  ORF Transcript_414/g.591 Transcript_414/m.591 type:complete len:80 (+) Transcript_414:1997-2236(+)
MLKRAFSVCPASILLRLNSLSAFSLAQLISAIFADMFETVRWSGEILLVHPGKFTLGRFKRGPGGAEKERCYDQFGLKN